MKKVSSLAKLAPFVLFLPLCSGCSVLSVFSTGLSVASPKIGWFEKDAEIVRIEEIPRPAVPYNLKLHVRYLLEGIDTEGDGPISSTVAWLFRDPVVQHATKILEELNIAQINDRGMDGEVLVEVADTIDKPGTRYLPFVTAIRWTETKHGKVRITVTNSSGEKCSSKIQQEKIYVQSGLFSDSILDKSKNAPFIIKRTDYFLEGEAIALDKLNEQLLLRAVKRLQENCSLETFFAVEPQPLQTDEDSAGTPAQADVITETIRPFSETEKSQN